MYRSEPDPYCYPGTTILINRLDIRDQSTLEAFEAEMSSERATEPLPGGPLTCEYYLAIHHHLFQDVYEWAGKIRTVRITKGNSAFCYPEHIESASLGLCSNPWPPTTSYPALRAGDSRTRPLPFSPI